MIEKQVTIKLSDGLNYLGIARGMIADAIPRLNRALDEIDNLTQALESMAIEAPEQKELNLTQEKIPNTELKSSVFTFDIPTNSSIYNASKQIKSDDRDDRDDRDDWNDWDDWSPPEDYRGC